MTVPPAQPTYWTPPGTLNPQGRERSIGIEIELAGLDVQAIGDIITRTYGGHLESSDLWSGKVSGTSLQDYGDFKIELDAAFLKEDKLPQYLEKLGLEKPETFATIEEWVARSARQIVPMEVVAPPLPLSKLPELERLRHALSQSLAQDTHASVFYAFGMHINPEVTSCDADEIRDTLSAFLILYEWLREKHHIDLTRRITPFIEPFPTDYTRLLLNPDYNPQLEGLIRDYLEYNPNRNRPLDLLPLFTHLREDTVRAHIEPRLVSPRPTYHYRLPNCSLNNPAWSLAEEWNRWVVVERVASDKTRLHQLAADRLQWLDHPAQFVLDRISEKVKSWFS